MEIGGLMADTFKIFLGNPDIMAVIITFTVAVSILLTVMELKILEE